MSNETTPVGPYTIEARESEPHNQNFFRVVGPHFIGGWLTNAEADYLCRHLNSAYAAGQASREQWISVDERLPELHDLHQPDAFGQSEEVLVSFINQQSEREQMVDVLQRGGQGDTTTVRWCNAYGVTHWMPLPSPPNKQP